MEIQCHEAEGTFVETNAIKKFKKRMYMKDVFVIIGKEGSGKSRNGLEILRLFGLTYTDFDLLKVTDFQQVKDIISDKGKTVVLLDDVIPFKLCSCKCLINYHMFDLLNAWKCKGDVKIIFTLNSSDMNLFTDKLAFRRLFRNCCKIDLSAKKFCMSENEKAQLLIKFCSHYEIEITRDSLCCSQDFYLDGKIVNAIAKTDPFTGYPQLCFMFTSNKRFLQLGINFFKHPDQSLMDEINSLRDSTDMNIEQNLSYAILIYTLLDTGGLAITNIDISKLKTIMDSCFYSPQRRILINKVIKSAELMDGHLFRKDAQTMVYYFKHPMISEALAISYYAFNPSAVISVLNFDFIVDLIRLETNNFKNHQISLIIEKEMFVNLTKRILTIFKTGYEMKSAYFIKMLCDSSIILQYNQDFIGILIRVFNNCTSEDTIDIRIEGRHDQMTFHFLRALLWFLIQKHNVDKHIATVLHSIENDMKDKQNLENSQACKKVLLACFYYLCEFASSENSDIKLELIYRLIKYYGVECSYNYSIHIALKNANDLAARFLLSHICKEIDIVKLIFNLEISEDLRKLCNLVSNTFSINSIDTDDKTDILNNLFKLLPMNVFNVRASINTACSKLCKDLVTGILSDVQNLTFDTGNVVNTACENGWVDVLKILFKKNICSQSEKRQIFTTSCKDGMETFLKWMFVTVDPDELDIQQLVLHEFRCEHFETVQNFILKLQDHEEMETMIKNLVTQFSLPIIRFVQWVLEDTEKQICTDNESDLQRLYIVQWIYERFPDLQTDVRNTVYKTINDSCDNSDEILQWLNENTKGMVYPITSLLEFSCRNYLQKIVKWILQTFDHNTFYILDLIIESYKVGNTKMAEVIIREIDLIKIDVTSVITAMLSTCRNTSSKDPFLFLIHNIDQSYCRWMEIITIIIDLELYSYISLVIQHVDNSKIDMMKIVLNKFNVLSENKLKVLIQSIKKELIDINYIVSAAFKIGYNDIVAWAIKNDNQNAINKSKLFDAAVFNGNTNVMYYLLENIDHTLLNIETALDIACRRGKFDIVEMLLLHVNDTEFDVKEAIDKVFSGITFDTVKSLSDSDNLLEINPDKASESERIKIVKLMLETFDHKLFDMTTIMNTAFEQRWVDIIKWVIKEVDDSLLDLNEILSMACRSELSDIVTLLAGKIRNSNVDKGAVMKTVFVHGSFNSIKLLIPNIDIPLVDLGTAMNEACRDGKSDLIKKLIENDNSMIDLTRLFKIACDKSWQDIVKCVIENVENSLLDTEKTMTNACWSRNLDIMKWSIDKIDTKLFDIKDLMTKACLTGNLTIVKWLIENFNNISFDIKKSMNNACWSKNLDIVKWLIENFDNKLFDMEEAMNNACLSKNLDIVKWLIENFNNSLFNMKEAMNEACLLENLDIVKWLIKNFNNKLFNMQEAMNYACRSENPDIVKWFIDNFDIQLFNMEDILNSACLLSNLDIVKCLIENLDNNIFDMQEAMNYACRSENPDIVTWFIESVDNKLFDMQEAMNNACRSENVDTVIWLIENFDNKLFDMKVAMNKACRWGNLDIVKWLIENFDNKLFDMKEAMNKACRSENLDIVKWLIENFDNKLFYMKEAMNNACFGGKLDTVKWLIENFDNELFDMKEAMNKACIGGKLNIVKWLLKNGDTVVPTCFDLQSILHLIFDCFDDDEEIDNPQEIILMICKQGRHKEIVWTEVLNKACRFGFDHVVEWLLTNLPNDVFDFDTAIATTLLSSRNNKSIIITFILERKIDFLKDILSMMNLLCHHGYTDIAVWILQNHDNFVFDLQTVMNEACLYDDLSLVKYLCDKFDHNSFDMKTAVTKACRGEKSTTTVEWLWKNIDHRMFDMNVAMNNACRYGRQNVVEWLRENVEQSNFRMDEAFLNACKNNQQPVIRWMLKNVSAELLDISNAVHTACPGNTNNEIVQMLLQHIDVSNININLIIREACKHGNIAITKYFLNMTDVGMIDMNQAMTNILSIDVNSDTYSDKDKLLIDEGKQQLAMKIIQKTTLSILTTHELMKEICKNGWLELLQLIWSDKDYYNVNIDQSNIDIACEYERKNIVNWAVSNLNLNRINVKALMTESCSFGWLEIVWKIWTMEDIGKFDMKSAMNESCSYGRHEVVTWLLQNVDNNLFDMNVVMETSCRNGWIDNVQQILPLVIGSCNTTVAIQAACTTGNVELVQLLLNQFGKNNIDFYQISKSIVTSAKNADLATNLLQSIDIDMFDISNIFTTACGFGWLNVIKCITDRASTNCNVSDGMIKACEQGEDKIVTYLLEKFPQYPFDFQSSLLAACEKGWDEIAELLLDTVDHNILNIEKIFMNICRSREADIVNIILKKVDHNLLNLIETINTLIKDKKNEQVVLRIIKTAHKTKWNKQSLLEKAREHSWWKVLAFLHV